MGKLHYESNYSCLVRLAEMENLDDHHGITVV